MQLFGSTRSSVQRDHALLTPDSHIITPLPGWTETDGILLISPQMGTARFSQYLALMAQGATAGPPLSGVERFVWVLDGSVDLEIQSATTELTPGGYAFLPADTDYSLSAPQASRVHTYERRYLPLPGTPPPDVLIGHEEEVEPVELMGDPDVLVRTLLPTDPAFDMAVNIMAFHPGGTLPMVEIHVMEHGLLMLDGQGIYRLGEHWYPVQQGDVIWMEAYCPQWFTAVGKSTARYLLYKDMNRDPLAMV